MDSVSWFGIKSLSDRRGGITSMTMPRPSVKPQGDPRCGLSPGRLNNTLLTLQRSHQAG